MSLYQSPVTFVEASHKYFLGDKELSGVTTMLRRQLPSQYEGIPEFVLRRAAEFGSRIHAEIEIADGCGLCDDPLVEKYLELRKGAGFEILRNEYLVSDEEHIASMIDQVMSDGDGIILGDAKTTSKEKGIDDLPHRESVTYQLNVYRVLFEKYNPTLKVKRLVAFWLDKHNADNSKMYDVEFIPDEIIWEMIEADKRGDVFNSYAPIVPSVARSDEELPVEYLELESAIVSLVNQAKEIEQKQDVLKAKLLQAMEAYDVKKWETQNLTITRVLPTTKKSFDSTRFKKEHEELYNEYQKETKVKSSIRITPKNSKSSKN